MFPGLTAPKKVIATQFKWTLIQGNIMNPITAKQLNPALSDTNIFVIDLSYVGDIN